MVIIGFRIFWINFLIICSVFSKRQSKFFLSNFDGFLKGWVFLLDSFFFFSFSILSISSHSLLVWKVSVEKFANGLMGFSCLFSLLAFKVLSLFLTFDNLIIKCLCVTLFGFKLFWDPLGLLDLMSIYLPKFGMFSAIVVLNIFSVSFFLSSLPGLPVMQILFLLIVSYKSYSISLLFFPFSCLGNFKCSFF